MNIRVSDRVKEQQPLFIQEDYDVFYTLLQEYYKSQEKVGRPYDIVNNLLDYFNVDQYNSISLKESTQLLTDVGYTDNIVLVEDVTGFPEVDGTFLIDKEVFYYDSVTKSPNVVLTPGISVSEFESRYQVLESILPLLVPTGNPPLMRNTYPLKVAGIPVSPIDNEHLIVSLYGKVLRPGVDYNIDNTDLVLTDSPRQRTTSDGEGGTYIKYLLGFAQNPIVTLDEITCVSNRKVYTVYENSSKYSLRSEILSIVTLDDVLLQPYEDFVFTSNDEIELLSYPQQAAKLLIRSIEYTAKEVGSGAVAVSKINEQGKLVDIIVKENGSGYSTSFVPRVTIESSEGKNASAVTLINGIKNLNLLYGGTGYNTANPPLVKFDDPPEGGTLPFAEAVVDNATGSVTSLVLKNSGSGYITPPKVKFINPSGAKISPKASIDADGKIIPSSLQILSGGNGYKTPPVIYIDSPTAEGSNNAIITAQLTNGEVSGFTVVSRGNGYTTQPRVRIVEPVGAQILDVTVSNGSVINIEILTGGSGYIDPPSVYIVDNRKDINGIPYGGTGAKASATIFNGAITDINITAFGTGYSADEPPTIYISPPPEAKASSDIGVGEVTGFTVISEGEDYKPSAFLGVKRGVSNVIGYDENGEQIFASELVSRPRQHTAESKVINVDSFFLLNIFNRFVNQYLPDLTVDYTQVNASQVVKSIKDFYLSKGTKNALEYLFKILYAQDIDISYPKDEIFKPSHATWQVETVLRAVLLSGDPNNLINSVIYQFEDDVDPSVKYASALVENVISIYVGDTQIYEISISEETKVGDFVIPYKTQLVESLDTETNIITVDSTLGWPERNGTVIIGSLEDTQEYIQYKEKTLNQFLECTRSKNGVIDDWDSGTEISSNIVLVCNPGTNQEVKIKVVGIAEAATTVLTNTGSYYLPGDKLNVAKLGATTEEERVTSWLYNVKKLVQIENIVPGGLNNKTATVTCSNPHGLLVGDQVTVYGANPIVYNGSFSVSARISDFVFAYELPQPAELSPQGNILISVDLNKGKSDDYQINNFISKYTSNIQNTFFNDTYAYVASTGIPNYKIGPFAESALIPGNQRKLNRFPLKPNTTSVRSLINSGPIATFVNGISAWSYKSPSYVTYGGVTGVDILSSGENYDAANPPILSFIGGGGTGASATVTVNGSIYSFDVTVGGEGYSETPLVSIVGGGGSGATGRAIVTNGVVTQILVETPGEGYTSEPIISISGGGGMGATAVANVRGPISKVNLISSGQNYTSVPRAVLSSGEKAEAQAIIINGRVVSVAVISAGEGYTTAPNVYINGDGFGAKAKAIIGTIGEDKGKVIGIQIINRGIGYTQGLTTIRLEAIGQNAVFKTNVFNWQYDLNEQLSGKLDDAKGYVFAGYNTQYGGEYAHVSNPQTLRYVLGDNVYKNEQGIIQEKDGTFLHSPIIGWAFDGNPIYGPYGYTDPTDSSKGVRRMRTSYRLIQKLVYNEDTNPEPVRTDGPPLEFYPAGTFIQDYEYAFNTGDLDEYNGRFCKTPEYPLGTYAYFTTIDASANGNPVFPYIIGPYYYSAVDSWNLSQNAVQFYIPTDVVRYRDPFEEVDIDTDRQPNARTDFITTEAGETIIFEIQDSNNDGLITDNEEDELLELTEEQALEIFDYFPKVDIESKVDIEVETTTKFESAQIDGFVIENPGINYKVNDKVTFDNTGTDGFGASAKVESIVGSKILSYTTTFDGEGTIGTITTEDPHGLVIGDTVIVDTEPALDTNFKNFKVKTVAGLENVVVIQEGIGYNPDIPPEYELITESGQDALIELPLNQGKVSKVNIINSGNGYSVTNPPQIRVTPPQVFKKANYFATEFDVAGGKVEWFDSYVAQDRSVYMCGRLVQTVDKIAILAKFNNDGRLVWKKTLTPTLPAAGAKEAVWKRLVVVDTNPHTIYVIGETVQNTVNITYNPDIIVAKYTSGFNAQNQADGVIQWQKELAGISGATRRDYASAISWSEELDALVLGGYTDTNTASGNDMWFMLMDEYGDVIEKRKVTTDSEQEKLTDIYVHGSDIYFTGIIGAEDIIYGKLNYDNVDLNFSWGKRIANPTNYKFVNARLKIDDYESIYLFATETNDSTGLEEKVTLFRIDLDSYDTLVWGKRLSPAATTFTSISGIGLGIDIFNNITIGVAVNTSTSSFVDVVKFKHNGTILNDSRILVNTAWEGKTIAVDSSADVFVSGWTVSDFDAITYNGNATISSTQTKFGTTSLYLDGTGDYVESVSSTDYDFSGDYTVESWVYLPALPSGTYAMLFALTGVNWYWGLRKSGSTLYLTHYDGSVLEQSSGTTVTTSTWCHVAWSRSGSTLRAFVNGILVYSGSSTATADATGMLIGYNSYYVNQYQLNGYMDEVRVTKGISRYNATFTTATAPFDRDSSTVLLLHFNEQKQYDISVLTKLDNNHTKLGTYNFNLNNIQTLVNSNITYSIDEEFNPQITSFTPGSAGYQLLDFSDAVSAHLPGNYTFTSATEDYTSRTATVPTTSGKVLKLQANVVKKFYVRDSLVTKADVIRRVTFNQNARFEVGKQLQWYTIQGTGENATEVVTAYGSIVETGDDYVTIGKIYGTVNTTSRLKDSVSSINEFEYTFLEVPYTGTLGTFSIALNNYSGDFPVGTKEFKDFSADDYTLKIVSTIPGSSFLPGDIVPIGYNGVNITFDSTYQTATITGLTAVDKITLTTNLRKIVRATLIEKTDELYIVAASAHNYSVNDIVYVEGFLYSVFNGSFFINRVINNREYVYRLRDVTQLDPITSTGISAVQVHAKHPSLVFVRGHQYIFDVGDPSNAGYYLSFSKDNQYKLEYSFNNITRNGNPGIDPPGVIPYVRFKTIGEVTNISYYFDPSKTGSDSPVGVNSFIDVVDTPYKGRFRITATPNSNQFKFRLEREPEGPVILDSTKYSTTSLKASGPINTIKLVNKGGFYKKLPIVTNIASDRQIDRIDIVSGGTEYAVGVYRDVPIQGDGEGGKVNITVELGGDPVSGTITDVDLIDPGKGYTTGYIDVDSISGILGPSLAGSGAQLDVVIPPQGTGSSVFLTGTQIGKIKKLKNNNFGYDYPHDYTLKPEITFPTILQLFNTSVLTSIKVTNPGAGYTSAPAVIIEGGGGSGAQAVAIVKNNRLSEVIVKDPGSGYSSQPEIRLKSEFVYVVNVDLGYFQFNFPHGITTGSEVTLRADSIGSTEGLLPQPSSAGLTSLVEGQIYYAIAGSANGLEDNQLRIALTLQDAQNGQFITFLNSGAGKQILLTEVFGGQAEAIVETSRFLQGEKVFQGNDLDNPTAVGYVSNNDGWQIGPRLLKVVDYTGDWKVDEKVTGIISKASGTIANINAATGTLNIGSVTQTPGKFIDNVGKPSEIVQKIQDSYFYQDFAYVVKSEIPINQWRDTVRKINHPAGFNLFGQLNLTGGKDLSGRRVSTDFTKRVDIAEFTNFAEITNFAAAQPIYSQFNNSEVIFRNKRLTNSEEILTSVVKKIDDISSLFDGERKSFPLKIQGEQVIASTGQSMILINGIVQAPIQSYTIANGNIEFTEAPKPPASIVYREIEFEQVQVRRIIISNVSGILPEINQQIRGITTNATATVVKSTTSYIDVINVSGSFQINETIVASSTGLNATLVSIQTVIQNSIFQFGEQITNLTKKIAIVEEINLATSLPLYPTQVSAWNNITAQTAHRFSDGADLINANRQYIIEQSFNDMQTQFPNFTVPGGAGANDKCKRDIGYIVDAIILDIRGGGNSNIIEAASAYFYQGDPISNGLVGEEEQSIYAFERARYYMQQAVVNQLPVKDVDILPDLKSATNGGANPNTNTNLNPNNCSDVRLAIATLINMITTAIQTGSLGGLPTVNEGVWNIGSATNKLVISKTYGTSKYETGLFELSLFDYFISAETGIVGKITKINPYRDPQTNQVVGTLNISTGSTFFGVIFERLPLPQNPNTIVDDISKTIIGASKPDDYEIFTNQNFPLSEFAQNINLVYDNATGSWTAGDYIRNTKIKYVNAAPPENQRGYDAKKLIQLNKAAIIAQVIDDIETEYPDFDFPNNSTLKCERDLGYIIDAVCNDIISNGNANIVIATKRYFEGNNVVFLTDEEEQSIFAFEKARDYMQDAITNTLTIPGAQQDLTIIADPATGSNTNANSCANIQSQIATLIGILTTCLTDENLNSLDNIAITDGAFTVGESLSSRKIVYKNKSTGTFFPDYVIKGVTSGATANIIGVNSANAYLYVEPPTGTFQSGEKLVNLDIVNTGTPQVRLASRPEFRFLDAADRIAANRELIKEEVIGYIAKTYPDFYYPKSPSQSYRYKDAANLIRANIDNLVTTAYNALNTQYPAPGFVNPNPTKCKRDLRYIALACAQDLYDGGNKWMRMSTLYYFDSNGLTSNGLDGEQTQSVYAFNQLKGQIKQAITNQLSVKDLSLTADPNPASGTVSNTNPASCTNVQNTVDTLFAILTTAITSGSTAGVPELNSGDFSPGETTCKRDLDYILDGFIYDLQYGGNSATVNNGDFYVDGNGNLQYILGEESESRTAFKYTRDLCIAAMRNFTVTLPSTVRTASSTTLTVTSTIGLVEGMDITGTGFSSDTKIVSITNDTTLVMNQLPASAGTGNATFTLNYPKYTILTPSNDTTLTVDSSSPECANVASAINTLWQTLDDIISTKVVPTPTTPAFDCKFGTAAAAFGVSNSGTNNIKLNNPEKFEIGTNPFTIEMWLYRTTIGSSQTIFDMRTSATAALVPVISINSLNQVVYSANNLTRITSNDTIGSNTWTHLAIVRSGLTTKMYINGVAQTQTFADSLNYIGNTLRIGSTWQDNAGYRGLMDEFRFSLTARYTANFTPATEAFEEDPGDMLLFHFDGANGTTNIVPESYVEAYYDSTRTSVAVIGQIDPLDKVLTVEVIDGSRQEYREAAEYIRKNKALIIDEMIGRLKMKYPELVMPGDSATSETGTNFCARDSGYIMDAIINDLIEGGNYDTVYTARYYLEKSGALKFIQGELLQSVYAYVELGKITNQILTNTFTAEHSTIINVPVQTAFSVNVTNEVTSLCNTIADILAPTGNRFRDASNLLYFNKDFIAEEVAESLEAYFKWTSPGGIVYDVFTNPNTAKCIRDMSEYIIPAMITDLLTGGNNATIESFKYYIDSNTNILYIEDELLAMYRALEYAKPIAQKAVNNLLYAKNTTNAPTGAYTAIYTNITPYRDLTILPDGASNQNQNGCANVTSAISTLFDLMLNIIAEESSQYSSSNRRNAAKLILFNKSYIVNEAYNDTKAAYPLYPGNVNFGVDIVNDMLYDLVTNGNAKAYARCLSWLDAFYNFIAFSGYNPVQLNYHLDRIKFWTNKAIAQTLNLVGPTTNQPRYTELSLSIGATTNYIDTLIDLYKSIITTPSSITSQTRDPGIEIPSITYASRTLPVPYSIGMEPSAFIYGSTSTTHAEVSEIIYNKFQIRKIYKRIEIEFDPEVQNPPMFVEYETITTGTGDTAIVYQTDGETYIDIIDITGTFSIGEFISGDVSLAEATITSVDDRLSLKQMMGSFGVDDEIYSQTSNTSATITEWNYNSGAILDNTVGKLTLDTETVSGEFRRSDYVYSSESEYIVTCFDPQGFRTPLIGEYIKGSTVTLINVNTAAIVTTGGQNISFDQGDKLDVIVNNLPTGQYATVINYDPDTGVMYVGNKTSNFDSAAQSGSSTIGVFQAGTLQPKIYSQALSVVTTSSNPSGRITRIDQSGTIYKIWLTEVEGTFLPNQQILASEGFKLISLTVGEVVARANRYARGFDGSLTSFKLTTNSAAYFPDSDGHLLVFVNGILQPPGADYAYTVFADNIQFTEAPAAGSTFHAYYVGKLRLLDDISFDFDSLRSSFNLKLSGTFYSLTITQGSQSSVILPENNIIVAVNGVLQEPGIGFKLIGSRITFSEIPRAGSSFVAFSYVGSDADVVSATVVPPIEIGDELFIEGEESNRTVAVIESANSLVTYEYSGSVKGRNGSAVAEIKSGRIDSALVTSPGSGYTARPTVDILSPTGFDGQILARVGVYRVDIANPGSGYVYPSVEVSNVVPDLPSGFNPQLDSSEATMDNTQLSWDQT